MKSGWNSLCRVVCLSALGLVLGACATPPFDANQARSTIDAKRVRLDGEQVAVALQSVRCGEADKMWVTTSLGGGREVSRLTDLGRELGFSDDIHLGEEGYSRPFAQLNGEFLLQTVTASAPVETGPNERTVSAQVNVLIDHTCFHQNPPQLMGIRDGEFSQTERPVFRFRRANEQAPWELDGVIH